MSINGNQRQVSVAEAKAKLPELLRRVELNGDHISVTRRGVPVAQIVPVGEGETQTESDWIDSAWGLLDTAPDAAEAIEEIYRDRQNHMPRELQFPWDDDK